MVEIIQQKLSDFEDTNAYIHRSVEDQTAPLDLDYCQVIVENVSSGKGRAGD